jgi:two-component system cell cycle response regulator
VELVAALAQQAVTALGNARRHTLAEQQALVDELTGIGNRRALDLELRTRTDAAAAGGDRFALVLADLDRFKAVNDRHGHPAGDRVLAHFAATLESVLRDVDLAGRWGGEEFALILSGANAETAAEIAERARVVAEAAPADVGGGVQIPLTASFGVAAWDGHEPDELVEEADAALYRAKANGRNRVERAVPTA